MTLRDIDMSHMDNESLEAFLRSNLETVADIMDELELRGISLELRHKKLAHESHKKQSVVQNVLSYHHTTE